MGTHLASIKTVFQPLCGNVKLSHACQVKVNTAEGHTYVFISIILHNNTDIFLCAKDKKEKTDVIKGHPVAGIHI